MRKLSGLLVAIAMLAVLPAGTISANAADETPQEYLQLTLTRTDSNGTPAEVGDKLTYSLGYKNVSDTGFIVYPTASNLNNVATPQSARNPNPMCRWGNLAAGASAACTWSASKEFAYHVVTEDDVANGFTPTATVSATTQDGTNGVLQSVDITGETVPAVPATSALRVAMQRTDTLGDNVKIGDRLTFNFTYTNKTAQKIYAYPSESNIERVDVVSYPRNSCRSGVEANRTASCGFAYHVITAEDVVARRYTPTATFRATSDRDGTQVLQDDMTFTTGTVTVAGPADDAASTPTERKDGEPLLLATNKQIGNTDYYRIPAIAQAPNGWILAAWDLRPKSAADAPNPNSIVQRISKDGGKSWETLAYVAQGRSATNKYGYSDPSYVVDEEAGKIFLFCVKSYDQGYFGSVLGVEDARNVLQAVVMESDDNGATWSEPRNITKDITKGHEDEWKSRFASSGHGIQLKYGQYKGRLIQQYAVRTTSNTNIAVSVYSDNHGKTWKAGNPVTEANMDENKVVELSDGRVMLNSRPGAAGYRRVAISEDGGVNYGPIKSETQLPDPNNNAQITRAFPNAPEGSAKAKVLLYSAPRASNEGRANGVVRVSFDDGTTWSAGKLFKEGSMAYSVITALNDAAGGGYGLLYEGESITYTRVSMEWLGYLTATASGTATVKEGEGTLTAPVTVTNDGLTDYTNVTVTPTGLPSGWSAEAVNVGNLAAGQSATVNVPVTVPAAAVSGTVAKATMKITGKYAQSEDTLHSFAEGELAVTVTEPDPAAKRLKLTIERTDDNGAPVKVGDTLTYRITYENVGTQSFAVYPRKSNLDGVTTPQSASNPAPVCRWSRLDPGTTGACVSGNGKRLAYHTVTEADATAGSFTPSATIDATADTSGETVLESVSITGDPVTVSQPVELPADIAAWKTRNEALDDWQTLSEKLAKTDRINWLFTGDSITHGVQFTRGYRTYSELFANHLDTASVRGVSRANDVVMNTGISSADASWPLKDGAFEKWVSDKHPDVVFLTFGMNDGRTGQAFTVDQYTANLSTLIDKIRDLGAIPVLQTQNYTTNTTFNANLDTYFDAERRLALDKNVLLVDFNKQWLELGGGNRESGTYMGAGNDIHPGENGHIEWAKFTLGALNMIANDDPLARWSSSDTTLDKPTVTVDADGNGLKGSDGLEPAPAAAKSVGKFLSGAQYVDLGGDVVSAVAGKRESNVTIRFRASATGQPQTLFSLGDSDSATRATVRLSATGLVQFLNSGNTGDFYTVGTNDLADGAWHTVSVNFVANGFTIYVDGAAMRAISGGAGTQLNVPGAITVNTATAGAIRGADSAGGAQQLTGIVDYVAAWSRTLTDAEAKRISAETSAVAVTKVDAAVNALQPIISDTGARKNIVFVGGETIEGGYTDHLIAKNIVQLLDERVRWEYVTGLSATDRERQRAKFFVAAGQGGLTAKQMDEDYAAMVGEYSPDILFLAPDLYDADGNLAESAAAAFAGHIRSVAAKAKEAGAKVVLVTPVTVRGGEDEYAGAMRTVAKEDDLPLIDAQAWIGKVVAADASVKTAWFNKAGQLNYAGHLGYARFMMRSLDLYPSNVSGSRIASLPYDTANVTLVGASENGGELPVGRVEGTDRAHIDTMQIGAAASLVVVDSYAVYEIGEDGGRTLVADGLKPADVLADGIDVTVNDTAAHRYEVVGSANVPEGADAVTVTYTATLAAVEEPEPGPDPDPTPDPSEKPDGDGTGDGTGAGTGDVQKPTPDAVAKTGADVFGLLTAVAALLAAGGVTLSLRRRANR